MDQKIYNERYRESKGGKEGRLSHNGAGFVLTGAGNWLNSLALVSVVPFALATTLALLVYPRGSAAAFYMWPSTTLMTEALGLALAVVVILLLLVAYRRAPRLLVIGVVVGIIVRVLVALSLLPGLSPFSDFEQVWQIATQVASEQTILYKSFFPEWCNYIAVVRLLIDGVGLTYNGLILASVVLGCIVVGEVYLLARIAARRHEAGLLAAALYALMPSQVIYALIPTPDMLSMAFLVGAACLLAWQLRSEFDALRSVGLALLAGLLVGAGSSFKPIGLVLAIAYAMTLGVKLLVSAHGGRGRVFAAALSSVAVLVLAAGVPQLVRGASEGILGFKFSHSATVSYLCIGLNTEGEGQIHLGSKSRYYNTLRLSGVGEDEAAFETYEMLREDWAENAGDLPRLFFKKVVWAWQDDMAPVHLLTEYSIDKGRLSGVGVALLEDIEALGAPLSQGYYLVIMALAAAGAISVAKGRGEENRLSARAFLALFVLGFFCLLLLSEAQSRYKSNVLPYVVVFSALGLPAVANAWTDRRRLAGALRERVVVAKSSRAAQFLSKKVSVPWGRVTILALVYMLIPVVIFFVGWTRWYVALACLVAFVFVGWRFLRSDEFRVGGCTSFSIWQLTSVAAIALLVGWACGWLGNVAQPGDWLKHNAVLLDLMNGSWPVYYYPQGDDPAMLSYYIGQYLVPALMGKLTGSYDALYVALYLWNCAGLCLVLLVFVMLVCPRRGAFVPLACAGFVLFNCALFLSHQLVVSLGIETIGSAVRDMGLSVGSVALQYRSFLVALRWVPPQVIVPWMAAGLLMRYQRSVRYWVFLLLPSVLFGTLSFVGLLLMAVVLFGARLVRKERAGESVLSGVREALSPENLVVVLLPGFTLLLYFMGNVAGDKASSVAFGQSVGGKADFVAVLAFLASYLVYALLVLPDVKRGEDGSMFGVIVALLGVIPLSKMGWFNDWCMCVSLCPLFVLAVFVYRSLLGEESRADFRDGRPERRRLLRIGALIALVAVAALQSAREIQLALGPTYNTGEWDQRQDSLASLGEYAGMYDEDVDALVESGAIGYVYKYYTNHAQGDPFVRYLARDVPSEG